MKFRRNVAGALILASAIFSASCRTGEPWAFAVTRAMNESGVAHGVLDSSQCYEQADTVALAVLIAPILIDIVLLPITLSHDCAERK